MVFPTRILSLNGTTRAQARGGAPFVTRCASEEGTGGDRKRVVVVGGGWAGFGAARHLADQGYAVTLLDAADTPGGLSAGWRTSAGRPVEAGIKGFWYDYPNIYSLLGDICSEWPLTPYLKSGFWGVDGLITEAPVFSELPQLPTLLGQLVFTSPLFYKLPLSDRLSILPWLYNIINLNASPQIYER